MNSCFWSACTCVVLASPLYFCVFFCVFAHACLTLFHCGSCDYVCLKCVFLCTLCVFWLNTKPVLSEQVINVGISITQNNIGNLFLNVTTLTYTHSHSVAFYSCTTREKAVGDTLCPGYHTQIDCRHMSKLYACTLACESVCVCLICQAVMWLFLMDVISCRQELSSLTLQYGRTVWDPHSTSGTRLRQPNFIFHLLSLTLKIPFSYVILVQKIKKSNSIQLSSRFTHSYMCIYIYIYINPNSSKVGHCVKCK